MNIHFSVTHEPRDHLLQGGEALADDGETYEIEVVAPQFIRSDWAIADAFWRAFQIYDPMVIMPVQLRNDATKANLAASTLAVKHAAVTEPQHLGEKMKIAAMHGALVTWDEGLEHPDPDHDDANIRAWGLCVLAMAPEAFLTLLTPRQSFDDALVAASAAMAADNLTPAMIAWLMLSMSGEGWRAAIGTDAKRLGLM